MAARGKQSEYILDQLICYMSNPLFQIPVLSFMEAKCLIFDPCTEDSPGYRENHEEYKKLPILSGKGGYIYRKMSGNIDILLEGFRTDTGLTHDQIIKAMKDLNTKSDLPEFQMLFEQILATDDFPIFVRIMAQKNLELQQQALMMIAQVMGGELPPSLLKETQNSQPVQPHSSPDEDQILVAVLAKSKEEYEQQQARNKKNEEEVHIIIGLSKMENARIQQNMQEEQEKLNETLRNSLSMEDRPVPVIKTPSAGKPPVSKSAAVPPPTKYQPKNKPSPAAVKQETNAQAAAAWLKSAETEVGASAAHSKAVHAAAANMAGMSEDEYKKRAEFLRLQRDKLMEMKKKEREKQLLTAEKSQPQRPASARAARAAMKQARSEDNKSASPEDEKKMAMRRAIADRLKSELMGQK